MTSVISFQMVSCKVNTWEHILAHPERDNKIRQTKKSIKVGRKVHTSTVAGVRLWMRQFSSLGVYGCVTITSQKTLAIETMDYQHRRFSAVACFRSEWSQYLRKTIAWKPILTTSWEVEPWSRSLRVSIQPSTNPADGSVQLCRFHIGQSPASWVCASRQQCRGWKAFHGTALWSPQHSLASAMPKSQWGNTVHLTMCGHSQ